MEKVAIRGIDILLAESKYSLANFLINQQTIRTGRLIAINAEKVIISEQQPNLTALITQAEYKYADGISIIYAIKQKYPQLKTIERIPGVELWEILMQTAGELGIPVFLVGGTADTLAKVKQKLTAYHVNIVGYQNGYFQHEDELQIIQRIQQSGAKLISVGMGTPKQELFIFKAHQHYPNALYMGVGGSYDVFIGKVKRAPKIWQKFGLEWLYRLIKQPTRWRRQLNLLRFTYYYYTKQL
ncbi:lipopolysaccharide N-acetylmannosaminouronosyltransferase [[Haemophilus] ducreyi]|uniref:lipopolysaccharide N-acetylmannosaminouronosyltransferase n=1 Tax=Haemophilus ducreyi TaxID=730 RepID=UPI0007CDBE26|nr:lipopolysaccharide N-acetylmannosaminouronosyltransferase [[Haemophilus] ducreyi]ANF73326.1 lipopolysaccharide N-acetylmannosaminouronosyltransferase [[Haemophilus] ducreyi]ANF75263.1 lipopolysaccharide N-acetylmannosaminouronosyltransferase [[Haemophilus] ducreyi]